MFKLNKKIESGSVYIVDYAGYVSGPYKTTVEAQKYTVKGDTIIIALSTKDKNTTKESSIDKITIDFKKDTVYTESTDKEAKVSLDGFNYGVGTYVLSYKSLDYFMSDVYRLIKNVKVIGTPKIEGEDLNALLHM